MKRSWLVLVAVIALGGLAGIAIAGRPTPVDTVVINPPSSVDVTTTSTAATPTTVAPASTLVTSTTAASTSTTQPPLDPANLRLLVANGSNRSGIARSTAEVLIELGYLKASAVDALDPTDTTAVYFRDGFEAAAAAVAADLNLTPDRVDTLPAQAVTDDDTLGDVLVVIGADYQG